MNAFFRWKEEDGYYAGGILHGENLQKERKFSGGEHCRGNLILGEFFRGIFRGNLVLEEFAGILIKDICICLTLYLPTPFNAWTC